MPSLFRRKTEEPAAPAVPAEDPALTGPTAKGYTPSKRELGKATPKRQPSGRTALPPPTDRKEQVKRLREKQRAERAEARQGMLDGDDRYLLKRDKGPERLLVRNIVDSRRTIGTWFFGITFLVMLANLNAQAYNPQVNLGLTLLFLAFFLATVVDSFLISRRVKKLVRERFPSTDQKLGSLYFYAIMRAISFRFIRNPKPKVKVGEQI